MQPAQERSAASVASVIITRRGKGGSPWKRISATGNNNFTFRHLFNKVENKHGGPRPVPSAPDDLFEKFLALGYVAPDDLKEMKERSSALGIPLIETALLTDRLHPDAR